MSDTEQKADAGQSNQITFHFIKAENFRVVHADGTWFGGNAQGNLHLTFYSERTPIPQQIVAKLDSDGRIIGEDESKRVTKEGMIREMEVDVVLSIQAATILHEVLGQNLKAYAEMVKQQVKQ